ncbi:MAG: HPr family phosphocarrier protein [Candidatus Omnitrophota bacterium]
MAKIEKACVIRNPQGLHARPAALFVQIASKYDASLSIQKDDEQVNGKSIMGVLMLGAQQGAKITLIAEGEDAQIMIDELEEFLNKNE